MVRKSILMLLLFCFIGIGFIGSSRTLHLKEGWWEIIIQLTSKGIYSLKGAKTSYLGKYGYTIQWSGCMEQDGRDFILYHENSELLRWEPEEKKRQSGIPEIKIAKDFSEKPSFAFNYILTRKDHIHFDFLIRGFHVPSKTKSLAIICTSPPRRRTLITQRISHMICTFIKVRTRFISVKMTFSMSPSKRIFTGHGNAIPPKVMPSNPLICPIPMM